MSINYNKNASENPTDSVCIDGKKNQELKDTKYSQVPSDPEIGWGQVGGLDDKRIRQVFIRKVYFILLIQLLVTFGIVLIFHITPSIREYLRSPEGKWLYFTSFIIFFATYISLACCRSVSRRFPLNIILLGVFTLVMSYMMGVITSYYKIDSILMAIAMTAFVCLGVSLFAMQTKYDFTSCAGVFFVLGLVLLGFGIACIFTYSKILHTIYSALGALVFSLFLAFDTQMIVGGKKYEISAEDHIFGALMLYMDVVNIFLHLLGLVGER